MDEGLKDGLYQNNIRYEALWSMGSNKVFKDYNYFDSYYKVLGEKKGEQETGSFAAQSIPILSGNSPIPRSDNQIAQSGNVEWYASSSASKPQGNPQFLLLLLL